MDENKNFWNKKKKKKDNAAKRHFCVKYSNGVHVRLLIYMHMLIDIQVHLIMQTYSESHLSQLWRSHLFMKLKQESLDRLTRGAMAFECRGHHIQ